MYWTELDLHRDEPFPVINEGKVQDKGVAKDVLLTDCGRVM